MTQAHDQVKSPTNKPLSSQIVQLHPVVDEKLAVPDHVWSSLNNWESKLKYYGEECGYMRKMLIWNDIRPSSMADEEVLKRFEKLVTEDYEHLVHTVNELEKEVVSALFKGEGEIKQFYARIQQLETQLNTFKEEITTTKLKVLKILANNPRITIF